MLNAEIRAIYNIGRTPRKCPWCNSSVKDSTQGVLITEPRHIKKKYMAMHISCFERMTAKVLKEAGLKVQIVHTPEPPELDGLVERMADFIGESNLKDKE